MKPFEQLSASAKKAIQMIGHAEPTKYPLHGEVQVDIRDCVVTYTADDLREAAEGCIELADWLDARVAWTRQVDAVMNDDDPDEEDADEPDAPQ